LLYNITRSSEYGAGCHKEIGVSSRFTSASRDTKNSPLVKSFKQMRFSGQVRTALGCDISLSGAGVVLMKTGQRYPVEWDHLRTEPHPISQSGESESGLRPNGKYRGSLEERIDYIASSIERRVLAKKPDVIVIEDYAFSRHSRALTPLHELGGVIKNRLLKLDSLWIPIPPTVLKKSATGSGAASKGEMLSTARILWRECPNDDVADSLLLAVHGIVHFDDLCEAA
jgi:Holliday junction resolvasome RuvABC endonuclease subunit